MTASRRPIVWVEADMLGHMPIHPDRKKADRRTCNNNATWGRWGSQQSLIGPVYRERMGRCLICGRLFDEIEEVA